MNYPPDRSNHVLVVHVIPRGETELEGERLWAGVASAFPLSRFPSCLHSGVRHDSGRCDSPHRANRCHPGWCGLFSFPSRYTHSANIDWAPRMTTVDPAGKAKKQPEWHFFGFGIWKSVYLVPLPAGSAAFSQLVVHPAYAGGHPTTMLTDGYVGFRHFSPFILATLSWMCVGISRRRALPSLLSALLKNLPDRSDLKFLRPFPPPGPTSDST